MPKLIRPLFRLPSNTRPRPRRSAPWPLRPLSHAGYSTPLLGSNQGSRKCDGGTNGRIVTWGNCMREKAVYPELDAECGRKSVLQLAAGPATPGRRNGGKCRDLPKPPVCRIPPQFRPGYAMGARKSPDFVMVKGISDLEICRRGQGCREEILLMDSEADEFLIAGVLSRAWEVLFANFSVLCGVGLMVALPWVMLHYRIPDLRQMGGKARARTVLSTPAGFRCNLLSWRDRLCGAEPESFHLPLRPHRRARQAWPRSWFMRRGIAAAPDSLLSHGAGKLWRDDAVDHPRISWAMRSAVAGAACIIEIVGPVAGMRRSAELTVDYCWRLHGLLLVFGPGAAGIQDVIVSLLIVGGGRSGGLIGHLLLQGAVVGYSSSLLVMFWHLS